MKKTKMMLFNPCTSIDFEPKIALDNHELEVVEEMRVLGVTLQSDMKWGSNTESMVSRANRKLWILRRLKGSGAREEDLVDIYIKQVRSLLEFAVPAWNGGISQAQQVDIERVQKCALHIILDDEYFSYKNAIYSLHLESLVKRREKLCLNFALKAEKHPKHVKWFRPNTEHVFTRQNKPKYCEFQAEHTTFRKSPLSYLTNLLNHN